MARSIDLDTVAPDDVIEVKNQAVLPPKTDSNMTSENKEEKNIPKNTKEKKQNKIIKADIIENLSEKVYAIIGHTKHPFSSLLVNPHIFDFEERATEEKIILVARPHWFTNVSWILTALVLVIAPSLIKFVPLINTIPIKFQIVGFLMWYLISFAFSFEKFLSWYFNVFIITDERVIDIDFNNLLDKKFSEAKISMIQDITSRVTGVGQTLFNYGTIYIQTAAEVPEITLELVPSPEKIIKVLQVLREEEERETLEGRVK